MGLLNRHRLWQVAVDAVLVGVAWYATYVVGFQIQRNPGWDAYWKQTIAIVIVIKLVCLAGFGAYNKWWRYLSLHDVNALLRAVGIASIALLLAFSIVKFPRGVTIHPEASKGQKTQLALAELQHRRAAVPARRHHAGRTSSRASLPRAARERAPSKRALLLDLVFTLILLGGARVLARSLMERPRRGSFVAQGKKVLIVGAGDAGNLILREMLANRLAGYTPIGLIDDDPQQAALPLPGRARCSARRPTCPRSSRRGSPTRCTSRCPRPAAAGAPPSSRCAARPACRSRRCRTSTTSSTATTTSSPSCAPSRSRTSSAASPCRSTPPPSAPTCAAARCS